MSSNEVEYEPMEEVEESDSDDSKDSDESMDEYEGDEDVECEEDEENQDESNAEETEGENVVKEVYLPGKKLEEGEVLVADESAYRVLHQLTTGAPCLSFDVIKDDLGDSRETYPMSMFFVAGTQAARTHVNNLLVMKASNLHGTKGSKQKSEGKTEEESDDESDDDDETRAPILSTVSIKHQGCVNRVRSTQIGSTTLAASWSELGRVCLWNLTEQLTALNDEALLMEYRKKHSDGAVKPIYTFKGHLSEGFGLDWCPTDKGTLATGDCKGNIHIWHYNANGGSQCWQVDQRPYNSHAPHSVEDLQWSPNERHVLASCSVDKSIKIWDTRVSPQSACMLTAVDAHTSDVNVINWNRKETRFIISGGDDGAIRIWDLRFFSKDTTLPVATFKHHTAPVTSVEWNPDEASVFASGGGDDQITQWDLSIETEESIGKEVRPDEPDVPRQLLFIHQGQTEIKELHWHPQCPGTMISTAHSGFNIFRTISV